MTSPQQFLDQLKRAQFRRQNKQASQVTTVIETKISTSTATATHTKVAKTKMSDDLYRTLIVAKAIHHIKQRGV